MLAPDVSAATLIREALADCRAARLSGSVKMWQRISNLPNTHLEYSLVQTLIRPSDALVELRYPSLHNTSRYYGIELNIHNMRFY